jgi:hypothetical protein
LSKNKSGGVLLSKYIPKLQQSKKNVIGIKKKDIDTNEIK